MTVDCGCGDYPDYYFCCFCFAIDTDRIASLEWIPAVRGVTGKQGNLPSVIDIFGESRVEPHSLRHFGLSFESLRCDQTLLVVFTKSDRRLLVFWQPAK